MGHEQNNWANWTRSNRILQERMQAGVWNGRVLLRELRDRGYRRIHAAD